MIYYLLLPVFSLLLLTVQINILDILFLGKAGLEISLILVIYAGFYLSFIRVEYCLLSSDFSWIVLQVLCRVSLLLSYLLIFLISKAVSLKVYAGGMIFTIGFTFICALFGKLLIILMYEVLYDINVFYDILSISFLQAVAAGVFAPAFFVLFHRLEVLLNVWESRSPDRL